MGIEGRVENNEGVVSRETIVGIYTSEEAGMVSAPGEAGIFGKQVASATGMLAADPKDNGHQL